MSELKMEQYDQDKNPDKQMIRLPASQSGYARDTRARFIGIKNKNEIIIELIQINDKGEGYATVFGVTPADIIEAAKTLEPWTKTK